MALRARQVVRPNLKRIVSAPPLLTATPGHGIATTPLPGVAPTPAPSVPPPAGSIEVNAPDLNALIQADPAYAAWRNNRTKRESDLATARKEAIRQYVLHFGKLPPGFKDAYGDLSAADLTAAGGNQFSTEAQIQRAYDQGIENMHRSLAARNMLQSGELGYGQEQADYAHGQAEDTAYNDFMNSVNNAVSGYTGGMGGIAAEEPGYISGAEQNVINRGIPQADKATLVGDSVKNYGFPVYKAPNGTYYKVVNGKPVVFQPPMGSPLNLIHATPSTHPGKSDFTQWMRENGYLN